MSDRIPQDDPEPLDWHAFWLWMLRWGLGLSIIAVGLLVLVLADPAIRAEIFAMFAGAGISVIPVNWLWRMSVSGEKDRHAEDEARQYFDEHGYWPDEAPGADH